MEPTGQREGRFTLLRVLLLSLLYVLVMVSDDEEEAASSDKNTHLRGGETVQAPATLPPVFARLDLDQAERVRFLNATAVAAQAAEHATGANPASSADDALATGGGHINLTATFRGEWRATGRSTPPPSAVPGDRESLLRFYSAVELNQKFAPPPTKAPFHYSFGTTRLYLHAEPTIVSGLQHVTGRIDLFDGFSRSSNDILTIVSGFYLQEQGRLSLFFTSGFKSSHVAVEVDLLSALQLEAADADRSASEHEPLGGDELHQKEASDRPGQLAEVPSPTPAPEPAAHLSRVQAFLIRENMAKEEMAAMSTAPTVATPDNQPAKSASTPVEGRVQTPAQLLGNDLAKRLEESGESLRTPTEGRSSPAVSQSNDEDAVEMAKFAEMDATFGHGPTPIPRAGLRGANWPSASATESSGRTPSGEAKLAGSGSRGQAHQPANSKEPANSRSESPRPSLGLRVKVVGGVADRTAGDELSHAGEDEIDWTLSRPLPTVRESSTPSASPPAQGDEFSARVAKLLHSTAAWSPDVLVEEAVEAGNPRIWDSELVDKGIFVRPSAWEPYKGAPPCHFRLDFDIEAHAAVASSELGNGGSLREHLRTAKLVGRATSANCDLSLELNATALNIDFEATIGKAGEFALLETGLTALQILVLITQMNLSDTQTRVASASLLTIGMMAVVDAGFACAYLSSGLILDRLFLTFLMAAVFKLITFAFVEMRYLLMIWKARRPEEQDEWITLQRQQSMIYTRVYLSLFASILAVWHFSQFQRTLWMLALSFWIPQIVCNAMRDSADPYSILFIGVMSISRLMPPLYIFGWSDNIFASLLDSRVVIFDPGFCVLLVSWVALQIALLFVQRTKGPRSFIPARLLPPKYDYNRRIPDSLRGSDCAICMQPVNGVDIEHMLTPCNHLYHRDCLSQWVNQKHQCPTCRATLPPL